MKTLEFDPELDSPQWHPHSDPKHQGLNLWWERKWSNGHTPGCPLAGAGVVVGSLVWAGAHPRAMLLWEGAAPCGLLPCRLPNFSGNDENLINSVKIISNCVQFYFC